MLSSQLGATGRAVTITSGTAVLLGGIICTIAALGFSSSAEPERLLVFQAYAEDLKKKLLFD